MKKSNINFKENTKLATLESIKHATFDQTNKNRSDFVDRKSLDNTTFLPKSESELVLPQKNKICRNYSNRVFFCFNGTITLTLTKIEEIKHQFQRKQKICDPKIDKACNFHLNEQERK